MRSANEEILCNKRTTATNMVLQVKNKKIFMLNDLLSQINSD